MTLFFPKTNNDLFVELSQVESKIAKMQFILNQNIVSDVSLFFFTESKQGSQNAHSMAQLDFEFDLQFEVTKLLIDNLDQLLSYKNEIMNAIANLKK